MMRSHPLNYLKRILLCALVLLAGCDGRFVNLRETPENLIECPLYEPAARVNGGAEQIRSCYLDRARQQMLVNPSGSGE
ncbi:hypothetical protein [Parendozoicomonas haliclonae]|uniref:Lipoprotein n=1 Tax=Parendozoicomonas haliclonae TaxID=1960125 RepID=A0A1X7AKP3_9GAMM|nr:hypothetical protein [Parendozoicomonas haliclonae]SMA47534.1 hypothetical protein EHSB41UT_02452 [Parendozoicomonas haliclonae]